jgi:hypothetical protein
MTHGPGKYDLLATLVRERTKADGVVVMVFNGKSGDGFSVQASAEILFRMPTLLRELADKIEHDLKSGPGEPIQ